MEILRAGTNLKLVRLEMDLSSFTTFLKMGIGKDGRLARVEAKAVELASKKFEPNSCLEFVMDVCVWGGDPRRAGKVLKLNKADQISKALKNAYNASKEARTADALDAVLSINGLAVSFGSKHLKFLDPDRNVVLDSVISERLGYPRNMEGYLDWLATCYEFLKLIRSADVSYPGVGKNGWRVSDVEMAIFNKIRSE
jgi:hypothetical protein